MCRSPGQGEMDIDVQSNHADIDPYIYEEGHHASMADCFHQLLMVFVLAACGGGGGTGEVRVRLTSWPAARKSTPPNAPSAMIRLCWSGCDQRQRAVPDDFANAQELFSFTHDNMPMDVPAA